MMCSRQRFNVFEIIIIIIIIIIILLFSLSKSSAVWVYSRSIAIHIVIVIIIPFNSMRYSFIDTVDILAILIICSCWWCQLDSLIFNFLIVKLFRSVNSIRLTLPICLWWIVVCVIMSVNMITCIAVVFYESKTTIILKIQWSRQICVIIIHL